MTSAVEICSNALLLLGDKPISDFSENNDRTRIVSNIYNMKRDKVLRLNDWKCAIKRVILSPETEAPEFEWAFSFLLPEDCMRILSVGETRDDQDSYEIEGRTILMNRNACFLRYVYRNEDESSWDALLIDAMTQVMVASLTYPITKSTTKQATEEEIVRDVLKTARAIDGQDNPPETLGDFPMLSNRMR
jgi:hypothetical protein